MTHHVQATSGEQITPSDYYLCFLGPPQMRSALRVAGRQLFFSLVCMCFVSNDCQRQGFNHLAHSTRLAGEAATSPPLRSHHCWNREEFLGSAKLAGLLVRESGLSLMYAGRRGIDE